MEIVRELLTQVKLLPMSLTVPIGKKLEMKLLAQMNWAILDGESNYLPMETY